MTSDIDIEWVRTNYDRLGLAGCAETLGVTKHKMSKVARKHGIKMTREAIRQRQIEHNIKTDEQYPVNPSQFTNVTALEAAYLLGLIWADGHLGGLNGSDRIHISQASVDMLDILRILNKTGRWHMFHRRRIEGNVPASVASTANRKLGSYLAAHGYRGKATGSADAILATIPDHLKHYWFRGLFDGDGSLFFKRGKQAVDKVWSIASDYDQDWGYLERLCDQLGIGYCINRTINKEEKMTGRRNRSSTLAIRRQRDIHAMMEYLYQGRTEDGIGLDRKWKQWCEFREIAFPSGNNRYVGVTQHSNPNWWIAKISKRLGAIKEIRVGYYRSEQEAYDAQQAKMTELGLTIRRERFWGLQNQAVRP